MASKTTAEPPAGNCPNPPTIDVEQWLFYGFLRAALARGMLIFLAEGVAIGSGFGETAP